MDQETISQLIQAINEAMKDIAELKSEMVMQIAKTSLQESKIQELDNKLTETRVKLNTHTAITDYNPHQI